jgi:hypothetical protein
VELAEERLAEAQTELAAARVAHDTSETAQALAEAKAEHVAASAHHAELTTQKVESDKHVLIIFGGTQEPVIRDIPEDCYCDERGRCRERRFVVEGKNVEHISEQGDVWVYAEM